MYAHPWFLRGRPELLSMLRKGRNSSEKKHNQDDFISSYCPTQSAADTHADFSPSAFQNEELFFSTRRTVSPCYSQDESCLINSSNEGNDIEPCRLYEQPGRLIQILPAPNDNIPDDNSDLLNFSKKSGKLGLLAMAMIVLESSSNRMKMH